MKEDDRYPDPHFPEVAALREHLLGATKTELGPPKIERCSFDHRGVGPRCVLDAGHDGRHLFKCAGATCPGYPWPASAAPHPNGCNGSGKP